MAQTSRSHFEYDNLPSGAEIIFSVVEFFTAFLLLNAPERTFPSLFEYFKSDIVEKEIIEKDYFYLLEVFKLQN